MLIGLVGGSAVAWALDRVWHAPAVRTVGAIGAALPPLHVPRVPWSAWSDLAPVALALTIVALGQTISIAKALAERSGQLVDANREFLGQGLGNLAGGFFSSYVSSGSLNRSLPNFEAGARTPLAAVFSALLLLALLAFAGPLVGLLPLAAVGGLLLVVAWGLVDTAAWRRFARLSRTDFWVAAATAVATLLIRIEMAILLGTGLSLVAYLYRSSKPAMRTMGFDAMGAERRFVVLDDRPAGALPECPQIKLLRMEGSIYFGAAPWVAERLRRLRARPGAQPHLLVMGKSMNFIDLAGDAVWQAELKARRAAGGDLWFHRPRPQVTALWRRSGFLDALGEDHVFGDKRSAIAAIYRRIDPALCAACPSRSTWECAARAEAARADAGTAARAAPASAAPAAATDAARRGDGRAAGGRLTHRGGGSARAASPAVACSAGGAAAQQRLPRRQLVAAVVARGAQLVGEQAHQLALARGAQRRHDDVRLDHQRAAAAVAVRIAHPVEHLPRAARQVERHRRAARHRHRHGGAAGDGVGVDRHAADQPLRGVEGIQRVRAQAQAQLDVAARAGAALSLAAQQHRLAVAQAGRNAHVEVEAPRHGGAPAAGAGVARLPRRAVAAARRARRPVRGAGRPHAALAVAGGAVGAARHQPAGAGAGGAQVGHLAAHAVRAAEGGLFEFQLDVEDDGRRRGQAVGLPARGAPVALPPGTARSRRRLGRGGGVGRRGVDGGGGADELPVGAVDALHALRRARVRVAVGVPARREAPPGALDLVLGGVPRHAQFAVRIVRTQVVGKAHRHAPAADGATTGGRRRERTGQADMADGAGYADGSAAWSGLPPGGGRVRGGAAARSSGAAAPGRILAQAAPAQSRRAGVASRPAPGRAAARGTHRRPLRLGARPPPGPRPARPCGTKQAAGRRGHGRRPARARAGPPGETDSAAAGAVCPPRSRRDLAPRNAPRRPRRAAPLDPAARAGRAERAAGAAGAAGARGYGRYGRNPAPRNAAGCQRSAGSAATRASIAASTRR